MTIMVDLEGTLSDHTDRVRVLRRATQEDPRDRNAWREYYKGLPDDEPRMNIMYLVRAWIAEDIRPLIYSTRFMNKYNHEEEWLRAHELWEHVDLIQRRPDQTKTPGPDIVAGWVESMRPSIIVDDRPEVRERLKAFLPDLVILDPDDIAYDPTPSAA